MLRNELTTVDNVLTRPWTVTRSYRRDSNPAWTEQICAEDNKLISVCDENYFIARRLSDAGVEGPAAAGSASFQTTAALGLQPGGASHANAAHAMTRKYHQALRNCREDSP